MRSNTTGVLSPNSSVIITIEPPVAAHEQPVIATAFGRDGVDVSVEDDGRRVTVSNRQDRMVPFHLFVSTKPELMPSWMASMYRAFFGG